MRPCDKRRIAVKQDGTGFWLGADYRMGASLIKAQGVQNKIDNTTVGNAVAAGQSAKTNAYGVGYQYDFSKRTALYAMATRFQNRGIARFDSAIPSGLTAAGDLSFNQIAPGMRHFF